MTREEKIELLNKLLEIEEKNDIGNLTRAERREFQQWVEALEQEPTTKNDLGVDCISRQATINAVKRIHPVDTDYDCTLYDKVDVMYVLNEMPSVVPQLSSELEKTRKNSKRILASRIV